MRNIFQNHDSGNRGQKTLVLGLQPQVSTAPDTVVFEFQDGDPATLAIPVPTRADSVYPNMTAAMFNGQLVRVPFAEPDGFREVLALRVTAVDGDHLVGTLEDDAFFDDELTRGRTVRVPHSQVCWVEQSLVEWRQTVKHLLRESSFANEFLGESAGVDFEDLHRKGFAPREALEWWRDFDLYAVDDDRYSDE